MGKGSVSAKSRSSKPLAEESDRPTQVSTTATAYPDWSSYQAYYNSAGAGIPLTPPAYFHSPVAPGPQGPPYMWSPQMVPPFGTPPFAAMYPPGAYPHPPIPLGAHPYSPCPVQSPNGAVQSNAVRAGANETDKSSSRKHGSLKGSKGTVAVTRKRKKIRKGSSVSNGGSSQSETGSSSERSSTHSKSGSLTKDGPHNGQGDERAQKALNSSASLEVAQTTPAPVVMSPLMPFWAVPSIATPAATFNVGMDYWGMSPASVSARSKPVDSPSSMAVVAVSRDGSTLQDEREVKRQRRKLSNRESARRSRLRKQAEWEEVATQATALKAENTSLKEELKLLQEKCHSLSAENAALNEKIKELQGAK